MADVVARVSGTLSLPSALPIESATVKFTLSDIGLDTLAKQTIVAETTSVIASDTLYVEADLWPNSRGATSTIYTVSATYQSGSGSKTVKLGRIFVPEEGGDFTFLLATQKEPDAPVINVGEAADPVLYLTRNGTRLTASDTVAEGESIGADVVPGVPLSLAGLGMTLRYAADDTEIGTISGAGLRSSTALTLPALTADAIYGQIGTGAGALVSATIGATVSAVEPPPEPGTATAQTEPMYLAQNSGTWTYPAWSWFPKTSGAESWSILDGGDFASVDAAGVLTIDTTTARDRALLRIQKTDDLGAIILHRAITVESLPAADYQIASQADLDALDLSAGGWLEVTARIESLNFPILSPSAPLYIRSASQAASIGKIAHLATSNVVYRYACVEHRAWPQTGVAISHSGDWTGCTFQRCHLVSLYKGTEPWDTAATDLYVYQTHKGTVTATTTPQTIPIPWSVDVDTSVTTKAYLYRLSGTDDITVEFLDSGGAVLGSIVAVDDGTRTSGVPDSVPGHATDIRVSTAAGSADLGYKVFQQVIDYMPDLISRGTSGIITDMEFTECYLHGWANAIKPAASQPRGTIKVERNIFYAVYQDILAFGSADGTTISNGFNFVQIPFVQQHKFADFASEGDPGDPHADAGVQVFKTSSGTISSVRVLGNANIYVRSRLGPEQITQSDHYAITLRDAAGAGTGPIYEEQILIGNVYQGGGIDEVLAKAGLIEGNVSYCPIHTASARPKLAWSGMLETPEAQVIARGNVAEVFAPSGHGSPSIDNVVSTPTGSAPGAEAIATTFPNLVDPVRIVDRAGVLAEYDSTRVASPADLLDYATSSVSGVDPIGYFERQGGVPVSTLATSPIRGAYVGADPVAVTPDAGVEWRWGVDPAAASAASWNTGNGTITPASGKSTAFLQLRYTTPSTNETITASGITIGTGRAVFETVTPIVLTNAFSLELAAFESPANIPSNTTVIEFESKFRLPVDPGGSAGFFAMNNAIELAVIPGSGVRVLRVDDSAGTNLRGATAYFIDVPIGTDEPMVLNAVIDLTADTITIRKNGEVVETNALPVASSGFFEVSRLNLLGGNAQELPAQSVFEYAKVWQTAGGQRELVKEISVAAQGSIAGINADPWHVGGTGAVAAV